MIKLRLLAGVATVAISAAGVEAAPVTFSASGANPAAIQATVDAFRAALGTLNANVVGSFASGRREINWDGVPDALSAPNALPANFFNSNSPRGVVFSSAGGGFEVSATAASGTAVRFGNIDASYPNQFQTFSPQRLFTSLGTNVFDVTFFAPGSSAPALTRGFGAVFTDVELANLTSIAFFDAKNVLLDTIFVPSGANSGLSFLGADYGALSISRVRITAGNTALGAPETGGIDLVVADDFIYGEPIPEPGSLALVTMGVLGLRFVRRRSGRS